MKDDIQSELSPDRIVQRKENNLQHFGSESTGIGEFVYDQAEQTPTITIQKDLVRLECDESYYVGEWNELDQRHGKGEQVWDDGSRYEGYWKNDMANGKGRLTYENGEVYEGQWENDVKHGYGIFVHSDGTKYTGEWIQDAQHG